MFYSENLKNIEIFSYSDPLSSVQLLYQFILKMDFLETSQLLIYIGYV